MSPLAWILLSALMLSSSLFILTHFADTTAAEKVAKRLFIGYASILCLLLIGAIWYFIGFHKSGTPRLANEEQRLIEHSGFYIASNPDNEFRFTGKVEEHAFHDDSLAEYESISLKPVWDVNTNRADSWDLKYDARTLPLRINGRCVNLPQDRWLDSDDVLYMYLNTGAGTRFCSIKYEAKTAWWGAKINRYYYGQGTLSNGIPSYEVQDVAISERVLKEGRNLSVMLRLASEELKGSLSNIAPEWWDVFSGITFIREIKGQKESRIGMLIADPLFKKADLELYRNYTRLWPVEGEKKIQVPYSATIAYGIGDKNILALALTNRSTRDTRLGEVIDVHISKPQPWSLPPQPFTPFIITSSNDYIPLDGYSIDMGSTRHPFYAKARLNQDSNLLEINEGTQKFNLELGQTARLGDFQQGGLISFTQIKSPVSYSGLWAAAFLALLTILFSILVWRETDIRLRLDLTATLIWGLTLTLLVVRLILAYRVSLLPPTDATPQQIANVFDKSLEVSLMALLILPLILLAARYLSGAEFWHNRGSALYGWRQRLSNLISRPAFKAPAWQSISRALTNQYLLYLIWGLTVAWILAGKIFGETESLLGLRINIVAYFLIILGLTVSAKRIINQANIRDRLVVTLFIISTVGLMIVLIKDNGFVIYISSLLIYILLIFLWDKQEKRTGLIYGLLLIFLFTATLLSPSFLFSTSWLRPIVNPLFPKTVFYRVVSYTETEKAILLSSSDESDVSMDMFLRNAHQNWQMLLYAAEGINEPRGYGQAPLSDKGMTYPTSMADCVFSMYLLSEHGKWAGLFLILVYTSLGFCCFYGSWFFPDGYHNRGLILVVIGAFFACNALYMAAANIGLVPFTGQNIPLMGLYSQSDILQIGLFLALIALLLRAGLSTCADRSLEDQPAVRNAEVVMLFGMLLWAIVILVKMNSLGANSKYKEDHNFGPEVYDALKENLPDPDNPDNIEKNTPWQLDGQILVKKTGAVVEEAVQQFIDQFNQRPNKFDESGGIIYLEKTSAPGIQENTSVKINRNYPKMRSPYKKDSMWEGIIQARSQETGPTVSALGQVFTISLSDRGHAMSVSLTDTPPMRTNRSVLIKENQSPTSLIFCELIRRGNNLILEPKKPEGAARWKVYVEGKPVDSMCPLNPYDVIVIKKERQFQRNLIYLGEQALVLAFVQWRNGKQRRIFPQGDLLPMAYTLGKAADQAQTIGQQIPTTISLTLDIALHRDVQKAVEDYARNQPLYRENDPLLTKRIAFTAMNVSSGEMLTLASWPYASITDPKFEEKNLNATPSQQVRLLNNNNLTNHVTGSTIKPLMFAAIATQLWPEIDLAGMVANNRSDTTESGPGHFHKKMGNISMEDSWNCFSPTSPINAQTYLIKSMDYYQGVVGMLGMLIKKEDIKNTLRSTSNDSQADITIGGHKYTFDLKQASESPFSLTDALPRPRTEAMDKTLLFNALPELYGVEVSKDYKGTLAKECSHFFPSLCAEGYEPTQNQYLDNVVPSPIIFRPRDFQWTRKNLISFFLGGGLCRWNNVRMAEAGARIATGLRVNARLEDAPGAASSTALSPMPSTMPAPVGLEDWRNLNIIAPMEQAGKSGTAASLMQALAGQIPYSYKILFKTGTIQEGDPNRESETLLFVVGKWGKDGFIPNRSLSCYLYLQDSKGINLSTDYKKFDCAKPIIISLIRYLTKLDIVEAESA